MIIPIIFGSPCRLAVNNLITDGTLTVSKDGPVYTFTLSDVQTDSDAIPTFNRTYAGFIWLERYRTY